MSFFIVRHGKRIFIDNHRHKNGQDALNNAVLTVNQIAPRGFEPLNENPQSVDNKALTQSENPVLDASLDKILQKYPDLALVVERWPGMPEHIKQAIKTLLITVK
jgi:hypothetical protein